MVRLCIFSSWLFTVPIKSSIVIVDVEEYGRAGVSEFNDFGVAVSFGVVVADLGFVEMMVYLRRYLVESLVVDLFSCCCLSWFVFCIF